MSASVSQSPTPPTILASAMPESKWTLLLRAQEAEHPAATKALGELMMLYWEPLYSFARHRGWSPEDAEDAVQGFYANLIGRGSVQNVHPSRGRLRTFFLSSFDNFLISVWRERQAQKRGSGQTLLSLDQALAEKHYAVEPTDTLSPEKLFDRRWICTLLERVLAKLRASYDERGRAGVFDGLQPALEQRGKHFGYIEIGSKLGLSENAVKQAVFRLRQQYRELIRREIADTVSDPAEVESELMALLAALA